MAKAIYTSSTHHCLVEPDNIPKEVTLVAGTVAWRVRAVDLDLDATDLSSNLPFYCPILLPLPIVYQKRGYKVLNWDIIPTFKYLLGSNNFYYTEYVVVAYCILHCKLSKVEIIIIVALCYYYT